MFIIIYINENRYICIYLANINPKHYIHYCTN